MPSSSLGKAILNPLAIQSNDFLFNAELLAKAQIKQMDIVQVGVEHYPRDGGTSTVSGKSILFTLKKLFFLYQEVKAFSKKEEHSR